jgi:hypothetical protein
MRDEFIKGDEVVKLLTEGWEIFTHCKHFTGKRGQTVYQSFRYYIEHPSGSPQQSVHHSTIASLKAKGVIDNKYNLNS